MNDKKHINIIARENGARMETRVLEEKVQAAVADGYRRLNIDAFGQHGIGGRLYKAGDDPVTIRITGHPGQRVGAMGFPNTDIRIFGPASDDVGWLNAGAHICVHGHAGNGVANAMAQGKIYIEGNIGARGMTMTKHNPRFDPPELWVLGGAGDYFGEFMAGGVAVICGYDAQNPDNVLGYRPLVGMVGGRVFVRGAYHGYSDTDAIKIPIDDDAYDWLNENLKIFLARIGRDELFSDLAERDAWTLIRARTPMEKKGRPLRTMTDFRHQVWDRELGAGGLVGDLTDIDRRPIPLVPTGELRRFVPVWENRQYAAPCEAACPTGIPVQERWRLIREGRIDEAVDLALSYTPFPAAVCGYLCPGPCMTACTKQTALIEPVDVSLLGKASIHATGPEIPPTGETRIAVIGGGPAGLSVAWQLRLKGHDVVVHDTASRLGGKISSAIPSLRIPEEIIDTELARIRDVIPHVQLEQPINADMFNEIRSSVDYTVIAVGAGKPRTLPIPGRERLVPALDFLSQAKTGRAAVGRRVVIIGAGNVGCDVAAVAHQLGAEDITLIDIQAPASFGKERAEAEKVGAKFKWPCFTKEITDAGVVLTSGEVIPADTVFVSIGDAPEIGFLPDDIQTEAGFVGTDPHGRTSAPDVFAIGDVVKPGLLTDAIGAGRRAADAIDDIIAGKRPAGRLRPVIDTRRVTLEYFDPRITEYSDADHCSSQCSSCGTCRDCEICVSLCPQAAISRNVIQTDDFEYIVDADRCIGCGFCAAVCPCGIWNLVENYPLT